MVDQTLVIRRTGKIDRKQIIKMQEVANRKALSIRRNRTILLVVLNLAVSLFVLLPLLYAADVAFMSSSELLTMEINLVPKAPTFENFRWTLAKVSLARFVFSSFLVTDLITLEQIISCSLAAFSPSFLEFGGKKILLMLVVATMMIPGKAAVVSNYLAVSSSNWLDSYRMLVVPYLTSAMGIFLFRQFYKSFSISLYESAGTNECTNLRFIFRILLPLTKSAIGATTVYTFINAWNMYMWPPLVTGSNEMRTVQISISMLNNEDAQSITLMIAGVILIITPSIIIFIAGQKQLIRGMFSGAVKG